MTAAPTTDGNRQDEKTACNYFSYGQAEIEYLRCCDRKLGKAIDNIGIIERQVTPDLFTALVKCIVEQQISRKAAETVWSRLCEKCLEITPRGIADTDVSDIQKCGLSMRKAGYIKGIGQATARGELNFSELSEKSNDEIIKALSSLPGIGVWTVEMLLIFSLCRPDVVSWGDLAIRRGMMNLYGLKELTKKQFDRYRKKYSPCGSVASLYLWALSVK
ncbi:MAG: DNA-3-methyladenine glycosylase 2 family protein [Deltaproteobacteria bacterium]|nr:DNA-3-methyladenine glycosylase 2 family protein [Deltaproteobacteria bacterium]